MSCCTTTSSVSASLSGSSNTETTRPPRTYFRITLAVSRRGLMAASMPRDPDQRDEVLALEQGDGLLGAVALAEERGQEVRGIVVGERGDGVGRADVLVHQELDVGAVALDHPGVGQLVGQLVAAASAPLQHRHRHLVGLERARHLEPDAPASDDEHPPGGRGRCGP